MDAVRYRKMYEGRNDKRMTSVDLYSADYSNTYWEKIQRVAAPEHAPEYVGDSGGFTDGIRCACGWQSRGYWDGYFFAMDDWRHHVADELGLIERKCVCGKRFLPIEGGKACHEIIEVA